MPTQPRHLLLDLDGTLTDPAPGIVGCYQHVIAELGLPARPDASLRRFIGPPLRAALGELLGTVEPTRVEQAVAVYRERFASWGLYANAIYPGIPELLTGWRAAGHELWIVTSKAEVYAVEIVRHFGIATHFSGVYGAELGGARSAKGDLIAHLLQEQPRARGDACMVGDREHDILGAKAHGLPAVGVTWGYGSRDELTAAGADAIVDDLAQLARIFMQPGLVSI